ncbi:DNA-binding protein [Pseudomonas alkylphenolica]|uniref:DNA-binding protein n=1 Tax=Pseudomonas alkylphenolica TaxID=237609 RepID=A0A444A0L5_9PSED|nr:winged helix-turn-helix domain-containing protein [Pseudomonas alkylphenolica]RWU27040.1 DNA-binding protein [Pseudomonas alkylphenolica]
MSYYFRLKNSALVEFDPDRYTLLINTLQNPPEEITLARADARILELLLLEPGAICSREAIMAFAWDDRVVSAGSLNQSIFMLRNILGDSKDHDLLITVPRRGYRFNSDQLVSPASNIEQPAGQSIVEPPSITRVHLAPAIEKQRLGIAIRLGYLAVSVFALFTLWQLYTGYELPHDLQVAEIKQGALSITAVGKSKQEVDALKADVLSSGIVTDHLRGEVFISRTGSRTNLSCVQKTGDAYNLEFSFREERLISMFEKCLGS